MFGAIGDAHSACHPLLYLAHISIEHLHSKIKLFEKKIGLSFLIVTESDASRTSQYMNLWTWKLWVDCRQSKKRVIKTYKDRLQLIYFELIRYDIPQEYIRTCENNINGVSTDSEKTNLHDYRNSSNHVTMVKLEYKCTKCFSLPSWKLKTGRGSNWFKS